MHVNFLEWNTGDEGVFSNVSVAQPDSTAAPSRSLRATDPYRNMEVVISGVGPYKGYYGKILGMKVPKMLADAEWETALNDPKTEVSLVTTHAAVNTNYICTLDRLTDTWYVPF